MVVFPTQPAGAGRFPRAAGDEGELFWGNISGGASPFAGLYAAGGGGVDLSPFWLDPEAAVRFQPSLLKVTLLLVARR